MQLSSFSSLSQRRWTLILASLFLVLSAFMLLQLHPAVPRSSLTLSWSRPARGSQEQESRLAHLREIAKWKPPKDVKVIALIFYGRRRYVEILECYLRRNLVENGGILDEVRFAAKTEDEEDLKFLDGLLKMSPRYSVEYHHEQGINFSQMYGACVEGTVCVKIDDDVVFIEDSTIRSIVKRKLEHPEYIGVSANVVNNHATARLHHQLGAVHPFLPEQGIPQPETADWRVSSFPDWKGPDDYKWDHAKSPAGHRWLPVPQGHPLQFKTPMDKSEFLYGPWEWWVHGAQQHYSFLLNLEKDELWRYDFEMWNPMFERVGINMFAITGDDLVKMAPIWDADEQYITMEYSKNHGRPFVIDGYGLAVHNGYALMSNKSETDLRIEGTDVLRRYKLLAEERVCGRRG